MHNFNIINSFEEIKFHHNQDEWSDSVNFKKKDKIVDDKGQIPAADYAGRHYRLVAKQVRRFSYYERLTRGLLGIGLIIHSFGGEWSSKSVKNLFVKDHESRYFGVDSPFPNSPFSDLPKEMGRVILSRLDRDSLKSMRSVNKKCRELVDGDKNLQRKLAPNPKIAFGKKEWGSHFGNIETEPPLPDNIAEILKSPCPFWSGKKVEDTHLLVLIPKTVNNKPLTVNFLNKLFKYFPRSLGLMVSEDTIEQCRTQASGESHWVLMTKKPIPESRMKNFSEQEELIASLDPKMGSYEVPRFFDAAMCAFIKYAIFKKETNEIARCREKINEEVINVFLDRYHGLKICKMVPSSRAGNIGIFAQRKI